MSVKVSIPSYMQSFTNNMRVVEVNGSTVGQCLNLLVKKFPKLKLFDKEGKLFAYFSIFINGKSAYPKESEKPVKDGDELNIILLIGGG